jgi:hypothetical protein
MIAKFIALVILGTSLTVPNKVPQHNSNPTADEIVRAGTCLGWRKEVLALLPSAMAMHPDLSSAPKVIDNATLVRPTSISCVFVERDTPVGVRNMNTKWMAAINLSNENNTEHIMHILIDLGPDESGAHLYLGWKSEPISNTPSNEKST